MIEIDKRLGHAGMLLSPDYARDRSARPPERCVRTGSKSSSRVSSSISGWGTFPGTSSSLTLASAGRTPSAPTSFSISSSRRLSDLAMKEGAIKITQRDPGYADVLNDPPNAAGETDLMVAYGDQDDIGQAIALR